MASWVKSSSNSFFLIFKFVLIILLSVNNIKLVSPQNLNLVPRSSINSHFCPKLVPKIMKIVVKPLQQKTVKCVDLYKHTSSSFISLDDLRNLERTQNGQDQNNSFNSDVDRRKWIYDEERMLQVHGGDVGMRKYFERLERNSECFLVKKEVYKDVKVMENDEFNCCEGWSGENCDVDERPAAEKKNNIRTQRVIQVDSPKILLDSTSEKTDTNNNQIKSSLKPKTNQTLDRLRGMLNSAGIYIPTSINSKAVPYSKIISTSISRGSSTSEQFLNYQNQPYSICQTWLGHFYLTFDNRYYKFEQNNCWYVMAKSGVESSMVNKPARSENKISRSSHENSDIEKNSEISFWSLSIQNYKNSDDTNSDSKTINFQLILDDTVFMVKNQEWSMNGNRLKIGPVRTFEININVLESGSKIYFLKCPFLNLAIKWSDDFLQLYLPDSYHSDSQNAQNSNIRGLCGNYNSNPLDDIIDSNVIKFATENKINGIENKPCFDLVKNYRSVRDLKSSNDCQAKSNKICGILKNLPGFKICDGFLSHLPFFNSCQETICSSKNSQQNEKSCQIISNYAQICMNAGMANLTNWRDTIPECQQTCSPGKIFDECVYTNCQPTCLDIGDNIIDPDKLNSYVQNSPYCGRSLKQEFTGTSGSTPTELPSTKKDYYNLCSPKCRCPSGYIEAEDGRCIRPDGCPCQFQNRNYKHGETITQHCSLCTCKSGKWDCEEKMCTGECQIISGQHVRTFDSLRYSINYGALTNKLNNDESNKCLEYIAFSSPKLDFELIFQLDNVYSGNIVKLKLIDKSTIYSIEKVQNFPHLTVNHSISERIPYRSADIFIETASSKSVTIKHFGKSILWIHDENSIYVDVEPIFRGKTFGLCGTFDFRESNEFKTLNGDVESSVEAFVRRFVNLRSSACRRIQQNSPTKFAIISRKKEQESKKLPIKESKNLITKSYATNPCTLFPQKIYFAKSLCNAIKTSKVFKNCSIDIVNQHVEMCEFGACQSDQPTTLCSIAANLARVCGKDASSWRSQTGFRTICQPKCPEGMIFEECINLSDKKSGAKTCTQLWTTNKYFKSKIASKITGDDKNKNGLNHGHIHELADLSRVDNTCIPGCKCSNSLVLDDIGNNYNDLSSFSRNYICIPKTACPCLSPDNIDDTRIVSAGSVLKRGCIICTCYYGKFNCNSDRCGTQITCPNNLMYSENIMACEPKTCKSLRTVQAFSKSYCENAPSYAGCTCPEGKVLLEESIPGQETDKSLQAPRCVTKNECPCYHNGKIYPSGAVISKGCSECTCVGVNWNCIENKCNAKCSTYGTPHYTTFDGNDYEFSGPCSYILARSNFGSFSITVENVPCGVSGLACTKSVYFNIGHMSIHLLRGKQVTVNNIPIKLPKKYGFLPNKDLNLMQNIGKKKRKNSQITYKNIADIEIRRVGSLRTIINVNSIGLTLIWDGRTSVSIYAKPKLVKQLSGLCGYYDNRRENDFLSRQGVVESTAASFARSWRVNQKCDANMTRTNYYRNIYFAQQDEMKNRNLGYNSGMENSLAPIYHDSFNEMARYQMTSDLNNCQYSPQRLPWARDKCSILYSDIFKSCHKIVPPDHFYKRCVNDGCSCSSGGDCECICTAISAYANECAENGFSVKWRSNELCPIQCDGKLEYYACGSLCEATCDDLHAENRDEYCKLTCIEGCFCPPGYVRLNDEKCVRPKQCPCKLQGAEFLPGTILEKNCQNCTCIAGRFNCIGTPCNEEHVCQNQLTEFYCQDNSTCIPFAWKCDGVSDCPNELDEKDCGPNPNDPNSSDTDNGGNGMFPNYTCREPNLEFKCLSQNHCIPKTFVCDGQIDCNDGSDEKNCVDTFQCKDNEFTCKKNGRCIRNNFVCDGQFDCGIGDKSDEEECDYYNQGDDGETEDIDQSRAKNPDGTCKTPYFQCRTSGLCIPRNLRCDGNTFDCDDNSDEYNCHCPPGSHYECYDGLCLIRSKVCDKFMDCGQGEEEMHCDYDQKPGKPDRTPTKPDYDDEEPVTPATTIPFGKPTIFCLENDKNCQVTCHKQHFTCRDKKKCLPKIWVCDGQEDCYDGSDELACKPKCQLDTFACDNSTTCLNMQLVCDGHLHCLDKSDESELVCGRPRPQPCQADWFRCQDHICLPSNRVCDGIYDCSNGEDESDCDGTSNNPFAPDKNNNIPFNCPEYTCLNGKCLNYNQVCNGRNECSDSNLFNNDDQQLTSSDEIACGQYSDWTDWSTCSESCGSGVQMRKRTCNIDHNGVNYDADSMTYYELLTHGIDPLRIKCPGVSRQMRPCTAKTCFGQWTIWSSWTECSDKCVSEYRSRYSKCSLNHCQNEQEFDKESGREIVYIGERDKIEIEECDLSKCVEQPGIETEQTCQAKNMQFFRQKPFVTTCRDLSFLYTELNKTTIFSDIQEIINLAELRFPKNLSRPPGCYCPTGKLLTDNNQCTDFNECSCLSPSSGQSYDHDQEISSTDGCEVCTCKGGLTTDCIKKKDCQGACRWTEWTAFGSCLGACGSNGIQWSFRNPVDAETAENSNCVGIFQKSRRCMTKPCPFCIDETGYDEDNNESQENLVERLHKYGDQWTPVDKKNYPCHLCTCLTNGTIACSKYCNLKNIGCPSGQELIVPEEDFSEDENSCCYCYDPNAPKPTDSTFDGLLTTIKNYFFPISTTENPMIKPTILPDTEEINNCKNNGNLICDINNSDGSFKCLDQKLVCDNFPDCNDGSDENAKGDSNCESSCYYTKWSEWSICSTTCNMGSKTRTRSLHPAVDLNKIDCSHKNHYYEQKPCMETACPIDGGWSEWTDFSTNPSSCSKNSNSPFPTETSNRFCNNPATENNGKWCPGPHFRERIVTEQNSNTDLNDKCNKIQCDSSKNMIETKNLPEKDCVALFQRVQPKTACGQLAVSCTDLVEEKCVEGGTVGLSIQDWCQSKPRCMCAPGYLLQNSQCVKPSQCNCQMNSKSFNSNDPSIFGNNPFKTGCTECTCGTTNKNNNIPKVTCQYHQDSNICQKVDCGFSNWSEWSVCSKKCRDLDRDHNNIEFQYRFRDSNNPPGRFGGRPCIGDIQEARSCNNSPDTPFCPSFWGTWSEWSSCSVTCGFGIKKRNRKCLGGNRQACSNYFYNGHEDIRSCGEGNNCPIDGTICPQDTYYEVCPDVCPTCNCPDTNDNQNAKNNNFESGLILNQNNNQVCQSSCVCKDPNKRFHNNKCILKKLCPCFVTDSSGVSRSYNVGQYFNKFSCARCQCLGNGKYKCNYNQCTSIIGEWTSWSEWSSCSATCSSPEHVPQKRRFRDCQKSGIYQFMTEEEHKHFKNLPTNCNNHGTYSYNQAGNAETEYCNLKPCLSEIFWSPWSSWGQCSVTCGSGIKRRSRKCHYWNWVPDSRLENKKLTAKKIELDGQECMSVIKRNNQNKNYDFNNFDQKNEQFLMCERPACLDGCSADKNFIDTCLQNTNSIQNCQTCYDFRNGNCDRSYAKVSSEDLSENQLCGPKCVCRAGTFMLLNSTCVKPYKCPCYHQGKEISLGEKHLLNTCVSCTCNRFTKNNFGGLSCYDHCKNKPFDPDSETSDDDDDFDINNINCKWSDWSEWTKCSQKCNGYQIRLRNSLNNKCMADEKNFIQRKGCHLSNECYSDKDDNDYNNWSDWSSCSATCGTGLKYRYHPKTGESQSKTCVNPACNGIIPTSEKEKYNKFFTKWTMWSSCSATCGTGTKIRYRNCLNQRKCLEFEKRFLNGKNSNYELIKCKIKDCDFTAFDSGFCPIDAKQVNICLENVNENLYCSDRTIDRVGVTIFDNYISKNLDDNKNCWTCLCLDHRKVYDLHQNKCVMKNQCRCFDEYQNNFVPTGTICKSPFDRCNICRCNQGGNLDCTKRECPDDDDFDSNDRDNDGQNFNSKDPSWCQWSDWRILSPINVNEKLCQRTRDCNCPGPHKTNYQDLGNCKITPYSNNKIAFNSNSKIYYEQQVDLCDNLVDFTDSGDDNNDDDNKWSDWNNCNPNKSCQSRFNPHSGQQESRFCPKTDDFTCPSGMILKTDCDNNQNQENSCQNEICCDQCQNYCGPRCVCPKGYKISRDGRSCMKSDNCGCANWNDPNGSFIKNGSDVDFGKCFNCRCGGDNNRNNNHNNNKNHYQCKNICNNPDGDENQNPFDPNDPNSKFYTSWTPWSACSATCRPNNDKQFSYFDLGYKTRNRRCKPGVIHFQSNLCDDENLIQRQACGYDKSSRLPFCQDHNDGIDPNKNRPFSNWSTWSICSVTCGVGVQVRNRHCLTPSDSNICNSSNKQEIRQCYGEEMTCKISWSLWSAWSICSSTCQNIEGLQYRKRMCQGEMCKKSSEIDYRPCSVGKYFPFCRSDGTKIDNGGGNTGTGDGSEIDKDQNTLIMAWTPWSDWSICSRSCNSGRSFRFRECRKQQNNDQKKEQTIKNTCLGQATEMKICNHHTCDENGNCPINRFHNNCTNVNPCRPIYCDDLFPDRDVTRASNCPRFNQNSNNYCPISDQNKKQPWNACSCPKGYLENSDGKCVLVSQCQCQMSNNGNDFYSVLPGQTWNLGCNVCTCENGRIVCRPTIACNYDKKDNKDPTGSDKNPSIPCTYTTWTAWSSCNVTVCNSPNSKKFRFRSLITPRCSSNKKRPVLQSKSCEYNRNLPDCTTDNDLNCSVEGEVRQPINDQDKCQHCVCSKNLRWKCIDICDDDMRNEQDITKNTDLYGFSLWSPWSQCSATCNSPFRFSQRYRHRICQRKSCQNGRYASGYVDMQTEACRQPLCPTNMNTNTGNSSPDQIGKNENDPNFNSSKNCTLMSKFEDLTISDPTTGQTCSSKEKIKINYCSGFCLSKTLIYNKEPYIDQICNCCSYILDEMEPVRFIKYYCPDNSEKQGMLPNVKSCECRGCGGEAKEMLGLIVNEGV